MHWLFRTVEMLMTSNPDLKNEPKKETQRLVMTFLPQQVLCK
jgi:hypothetical protein